MYGRNNRNIIPIIKLGTITKNFDFIVCDFIRHPIASIIKDNISNIVRIIMITLKPTKKMYDATSPKLFI